MRRTRFDDGIEGEGRRQEGKLRNVSIKGEN